MERARTMVFTVREAHGEVSGSVWEPFFRDRGAKGSQEGSAEVIGPIFCDL